MKNGDKPANAFDMTCHESGMGLTKREMIAMHISGHVMQSLNAGALSGEWEYSSWQQLAEQSVQYADALLEELEKQQ